MCSVRSVASGENSWQPHCVGTNMPFVIQSADSLASRSLCHVQCATSYSMHIQILAVLPHSIFPLCNMACTYRYWQCCHTPSSTHTVYYATWHAHTDTGSVAALHLPHTDYTIQHGIHIQILAVLAHPTFSVTWPVSRGTVT